MPTSNERQNVRTGQRCSFNDFHQTSMCNVRVSPCSSSRARTRARLRRENERITTLELEQAATTYAYSECYAIRRALGGRKPVSTPRSRSPPTLTHSLSIPSGMYAPRRMTRFSGLSRHPTRLCNSAKSAADPTSVRSGFAAILHLSQLTQTKQTERDERRNRCLRLASPPPRLSLRLDPSAEKREKMNKNIQ